MNKKTSNPTLPSILIRNANLINEGSQRSTDVLIRNGRIERIQATIDANADHVIEAEGKALFPGMIDCHVHFREPGLTHKGDMQSESIAAVAGGVTSVMEMPNTSPPTITNQRLDEKFALGAKKMATNYSFYLGASTDNLDEIKAVDPKTVCGVKVYMGSSTGNMLVDRRQTLEDLFRECPINLTAHCEDATIIAHNEQVFREQYGDDIPFEFHPKIRDTSACFSSSKLAVELAKKHNALLHILHISTAAELDLFASGRVRTTSAHKGDILGEDRAKNITSEACVHHLYLDDTAYQTLGALAKCNPAIKTDADRAALLNGLVSDQIDTIGTDHAPHTLEEKQGSYWTAPSGIPVIQSALPSILEHVHNNRLTLEQVAEKIAHAPARIFNIKDRGYIREGYWADLVLIDLNYPTPVTQETILYKCGWSPFQGITFRSSIDTTLVSGQIAWQQGTAQKTVRGHRLEFAR